ncbi:MAG: GNAT family N-acetyltransferase, partial [Terracidiphilus sp.]
ALIVWFLAYWITPMSGQLLQFRAASAVDIERLIPLINSAFSIETFLEGTRTDEIRLANMMCKGTILVAENESGQLLGCVYVEVRGQRGYLGQLAVDPTHQGSGLARRVVEAAEDHLRGQGCEGIDITVLSLRPELPRIYRRYGYVETGTEEFHPTQPLKPGEKCHSIVMSKEL